MQHVTVPRATWDAMREALEKSRSARTYSERIDAYECAVQALTAANAVSEPQALTLENAPLGTKAPAFGGGHWVRVVHGWKWCTGATFGRPGGDWDGRLIAPDQTQATEPQDAIAWEATTPGYIKYVTDKQYRSFSETAKRWYKPYKCSSCQAQATEPAKRCWCETCRPLTIGDMRMIVCPDCGNKRCPKATHHHNACTNSNDIGQKGSSWEHVKPAAPEAKQ